ncbi:MAG: energy transducer TonB [Bacteroidetes bacterium]|nr:energy transducer TonB [Bacteroidota bacterium]
MSKELKHKIYTSTECISEDVMYNYIDKKLSAQEEHQVEKHLLDCELCSDALEGLTISHDRKIIHSIKTEVDKKLLATEKTTRVVHFNYRGIWAIAAGLLLLIGGVFFFNQFMTKNMEMADASKLETSSEEKPSRLDDTGIKSDSVQPPSTSIETSETTVQEREENRQEIAFVAPKANLEDAESTLENTTIAGNSNNGATGAYDYRQVSDEEVASENKEGIASIPDLKKTETLNEISKNDDNQKPIAATSAPATISTKEIAKDKTVVSSKKLVEKKRSKTNEGAATTQQPAYYNQDIALAESQIAAAEQKNSPEFDRDDQSNYKYLSAADSTISVDEMPKFPGGEIELVKYIAKNFKYPSITDNLSKTKIYIEFIIDKNGAVKNAKILKGIHPELDKEALRVINSMPKWSPGKQAEKPVDVKMVYPIQLEFK